MIFILFIMKYVIWEMEKIFKVIVIKIGFFFLELGFYDFGFNIVCLEFY